jgi:eukaryotic-like serine/threonine-protein kinase
MIEKRTSPEFPLCKSKKTAHIYSINTAPYNQQVRRQPSPRVIGLAVLGSVLMSLPACKRRAEPTRQSPPIHSDPAALPMPSSSTSQRKAQTEMNEKHVLKPESTMISIRKADFRMGNQHNSDFEEEVHGPASVASFAIDVFEVTVADWKKCVVAGSCSENVTVVIAKRETQTDSKEWQSFCTYSQTGKENHPMNCVSWKQAVDFCAWEDKRLPTEEEWEWAAKGNEIRKTKTLFTCSPGPYTTIEDFPMFPWGSGRPRAQHANLADPKSLELLKKAGISIKPSAWIEMDPFPTTSPVGYFPKGNSHFGVSDMTGNVAEWVQNDFEQTLLKKQPLSNRKVIRGSHFATAGSILNHSNLVRHRVSATTQHPTVGFRCAKSL